MAFEADQGRHAQLIFSWVPLYVHRGHIGTGFHQKQDYSMAPEMKAKMSTQAVLHLSSLAHNLIGKENGESGSHQADSS